MPVSRKSRRTSAAPAPVIPKKRVPEKGALLIVDNAPLQREAWAEFHTVKKRLEKISRDLHRHEVLDTPGYEAWLARVFPVYLTNLRKLQEEVFAKGKQVEMVQALGYLTGRPLKKLWREMKEREENPELFEEDSAFGEDEKSTAFDEEDDGWNEDVFEDDKKNRSRKSAGKRSYGETGYTEGSGSDHARSAQRHEPNPSKDAKAIYRRLVQNLHPDRGGEWTPARQRLWHDVQQAWAEGDADWLARLEVEWETANDQLGPASPLSRLRTAIAELHGARRDLERKLRDYRGAFSWRFTLREKDRHELRRRLETNFKHDIAYLAGQLRYLDATIAAWEGRARARV